MENVIKVCYCTTLVTNQATVKLKKKKPIWNGELKNAPAKIGTLEPKIKICEVKNWDWNLKRETGNEE